ncbi:MAG: VOC family protein [Ignavibacteria bacterium]|nr:VOC family protein [Ignavibacteria bacterium]
MTTVNIYLTLNGNCEEAFNFYKSIFGGEFPYVGRFKDMPPHEGSQLVSEAYGEKIMHISLPISKETILMGSDVGGEWSNNYKMGNNFTISANTDNTDEADRIFNALADGGKITMAMNETFWESYFGMLTDKFGINWMVNCELKGHKDFEDKNRKDDKKE